MNCGNLNTSSCGGCHQPSSQNANKCCNSNLPVQFDPVYPAKTKIPTNSSNRKTTKASKKSIGQSDDQTMKKKDLKNKNQKSNNDCGSTKNQSNTTNPNKRCNASQGQPNNLCCCGNCDKSDDMNESLKSSETGNSCTMENSSNVKNLKNYNPQIKELGKGCGDFDDITSSDNEVWLLKCPKDFDPQQMLCCQLGNQTKVECSADRFSEKKTLAIIAPEKVAEYQMICDNLKLVKPVGKIVLSEKYNDNNNSKSLESTKCSLPSQVVDCSQLTSTVSSYNSDECSINLLSDNDCDMSETELSTKSLCSKKLSKNFSDQKYSIETTVTTEKSKRRKRNKNSCDCICLPLVPPEPTPLKKKNSSKRDGCC